MSLKTSDWSGRSGSAWRRCVPHDRRRLPILTEIDVHDLRFGDQDLLIRIVVSIRLDSDFDGDGGRADPQRLAPEADQIAHEHRLMEHNLVHGHADHDARALAPRFNRASLIDERQNHPAEDRALRVRVPRHHQHADRGLVPLRQDVHELLGCSVAWLLGCPATQQPSATYRPACCGVRFFCVTMGLISTVDSFRSRVNSAARRLRPSCWRSISAYAARFSPPVFGSTLFCCSICSTTAPSGSTIGPTIWPTLPDIAASTSALVSPLNPETDPWRVTVVSVAVSPTFFATSSMFAAGKAVASSCRASSRAFAARASASTRGRISLRSEMPAG